MFILFDAKRILNYPWCKKNSKLLWLINPVETTALLKFKISFAMISLFAVINLFSNLTSHFISSVYFSFPPTIITLKKNMILSQPDFLKSSKWASVYWCPWLLVQSKWNCCGNASLTTQDYFPESQHYGYVHIILPISSERTWKDQDQSKYCFLPIYFLASSQNLLKHKVNKRGNSCLLGSTHKSPPFHAGNQLKCL